MQVNELAFTQDGKLFLQATESGVEVGFWYRHVLLFTSDFFGIFAIVTSK